jgi:hypothetical protein
MADVGEMDASTMAQAESDLEKFVQALAGVAAPKGDIADHPWHGITRATLSPTDWSALCDALAIWQRAGERVEAVLVGMAVRTGIVMARTPETVAALGGVYAALPEDPRALYPDLLARAGGGAAAAEMEVVAGQLARVAELERQCAAYFGTVRVLPETQIDSSDRLLAEAEAMGQSRRPLGELARLGRLAG